MTRETSESPLLPARLRFKPYPAYQDSGVEWLGEIPTHCEVQRTKHVARLRSGHTPSRQHPEYWVHCTIPWFGLADVWQLRDGRQEYVAETSEKISALGLANSAARLLPKGTVILSRTASVGFSGIMATEMATTQDFVNWVCGESIRSEYLLYVFRSMTHEFRRLTMGSTHQTIYMPDVGTFSTPVPPIVEQDRIVAFVRKETARIDGLVAKTERLVELLQEKRTALITRAVTQGFDPSVPMKNSGVEWLGEIPAYWEVTPLRWSLSVRSGEALPNTEFELTQSDDRHIPVIGGNGVMGYSDRFNTAEPCIAVGRVGALCGNVHLVDPPAWVTDNALLLSDIQTFDRQYLAMLLEVLDLNRWASQNAQPLITGAFLKAQRVCRPAMAEQRHLVERLKAKKSSMGALIERIRHAIERLNEYRSALISAAVTGKIDVRAA